MRLQDGLTLADAISLALDESVPAATDAPLTFTSGMNFAALVGSSIVLEVRSEVDVKARSPPVRALESRSHVSGMWRGA